MIVGTNLFSRLKSLSQQTSKISDALAEASKIATTGLKITTPSDSPEMVNRIQDLTAAISDNQRYSESAGTAETMLSLADTTLSSLADVLTASHELAVQLSSETFNSDTRIAAAVTAEGFLEEALSLVNMDVSGRALFAGTAYDGDAYDSTLTYTGNNEASFLDVGDAVSVTVGFDGSALGLGDALTAIAGLETALAADDIAAVQASMDSLESALNSLSQVQASIGSELNTADDFSSFAESMEYELASQLSNVQEVDPIEALVRFNELQTMYETALSVTASSNTGSLFERI
jgi:flagellar hook-associated protein 3 FlgL